MGGDTSRGGLFMTSDMDSALKKQERLMLIDALWGVEMPGLEHMAIVQTEFYVAMDEETRLSIATEKYQSGKLPPEKSIREGETHWYSTNISENITILTFRLW